MEQLNEKPQLAAGARVGTLPTIRKKAGGATHSLPQIGGAVKTEKIQLLLRQEEAAEQRATAAAAWHLERAARYLAWIDLPWCAAQYAAHVGAAEFQERIAARHAAVRVSLGEVRP